MFQAYTPPDDTNDWTDTLTQKVAPLAGAAIGGVAGGLAGGAAGVAPGIQAGFGLGESVGGLFNKKKGSEEQVRLGLATGAIGGRGLAQVYANRKQYGDPQVDELGGAPQAAPSPAGPQSYTSPYALYGSNKRIRSL
jgi:hypothetical protein